MLPVTEVLTDYEQNAPQIGAEGVDFPSLYELINGEWCEFPHAEEDVYDMLQSYGAMRSLYAVETTAVVITTSGWAAPLGKNGEVEGRPSEHPQRFRCAVRMCLELDNGGLMSRVHLFKEDTEEVADDYGNASGALADALTSVGLGLWGQEWTHNLLMWWAGCDREAISADVRKALADRLRRLVQIFGESEGE